MRAVTRDSPLGMTGRFLSWAFLWRFLRWPETTSCSSRGNCGYLCEVWNRLLMNDRCIFFPKKGSDSPLWFAFRLLMSAPEGDSPQTPTAIKAHPMIIMRRAQPAYRYYNLFPCLLVSFLLACIVQPSGATHRSQTAKKWTGPQSFSLEPSCNWQQTHTQKKTQIVSWFVWLL